jgi:hypothetical protein
MAWKRKSSMPDVACITAAAPGRPPQFLERARFYVARFSKWYNGSVEHVVKEGPSMLANMKALVDSVDTQYIVIIEDDDWYSAKYLAHMVKYLEFSGAYMMGIDPTVYYHIKTERRAILRSRKHCSMFTTVGRSYLIRNLVKLIPDEVDGVQSDMWMWRKAQEDHIPVVSTVVPLAVGIKHGMGKCLGQGHNPNLSGYRADQKAEVRCIFGDDMQFYKKMRDLEVPPTPSDDGGMIDIL